MPKQPKPAEKPKPFTFKGFVRCDLNRSEEADYKEWSDATTDEDLFDLVLEVADSGYKFSVGEGSRGMSASLSNFDGPAESRGYILSAFGATADRAIRALMFKHFRKLDKSWPVGDASDGWDLG